MSNNAYVGIDASKGYADIITLRSNKEIVEAAFRLYDASESYQRLSVLIDQWLQMGLDNIYCGVESTGGYENNWVSYLQQLAKSKPVHVARLNPKAVKALGEAALRRTITDSVSAENIALYLIDFAHKIHYLKDTQSAKVYKDARMHDSFIRILKKQKNQLGNQLEKILYQELSPLMCYCQHGFPGWLLLLLQKYPGVEFIKKAGVGKLSKIKGISNERAVALIQKVSSMNHATSAHISSIIRSTVAQLLHLEKSIQAEKTQLIDRFRKESDVLLLTSIPGIGEQSAVELLIEIEDVNRFESAKKMVAYFGTHPMWKQSGDGTWGNHMSKKGRPEIRAVLYMCCMSAVRHEKTFKGIYTKARAQGKNHFSAIGVVMNKMLRVSYGVLKSKIRYNDEVDLANQQNAKAKQQEKEAKLVESKQKKQTKLERYNPSELNDKPVSKRYVKKKRHGPNLPIEERTESPAS